MLPFRIQSERTITDYDVIDGRVKRLTTFVEDLGTEDDIVEHIEKKRKVGASSTNAEIKELDDIERKTNIKFKNKPKKI